MHAGFVFISLIDLLTIEGAAFQVWVCKQNIWREERYIVDRSVVWFTGITWIKNNINLNLNFFVFFFKNQTFQPILK